MIFKHTSKERGMWRGWLEDGQSVEICWGKRGWSFGARVTIHSDDDDQGRRLLNLSFWRISTWIPLGKCAHPWERMDGPQWGIEASKEFGFQVYWGQRRKSWDWPWDWHTLAYEEMMPDGSWQNLRYSSDSDAKNRPYYEKHPYTYTLRSGEVQERVATISKRRHVITWRALRAVGWPRWVKESINIEFDGEVGERSGSWKGGCIGCSYDIRRDETMLSALRRMEAERTF